MRFLLFSFLLFAMACSNSESQTAEKPIEKEPAKKMETPKVQAAMYDNATLDKLGMDTTTAIPHGLKVGDNAPDFRSIDQNGDPIHLAEQLSKGPVVVVFYRGEWCGLCNKYLTAFADSLSMVKEKGASVIAIAPEVVENVQKTIEKTGLEVPAIADKGHHIMDSYDVTFKVTEGYQKRILDYKGKSLAEMNGDTEAYLPVPATYIIGQNGKIKEAFFDAKYNKRMYVKDILAKI